MGSHHEANVAQINSHPAMNKLLLTSLLFLIGCSQILTANQPERRPAPVVPRVEIVHSAVVQNSPVGDFYRLCDFGPDNNILSTHWLDEARKRFANPIVIVCHGSFGYDTENGRTIGQKKWYLYPDEGRRHKESVEGFVSTLTNLAPDRDIVLVVCNEGAFTINVPHVYYAKRKCWVVPNAWTGDFPNKEECAGDIGEFVGYDSSKPVQYFVPDEDYTVLTIFGTVVLIIFGAGVLRIYLS